jgi:hypothetical protein
MGGANEDLPSTARIHRWGSAARRFGRSLRARMRPALPVIGVLSTGSIGFLELAAFREGLKETGYVEGQNVAHQWNQWLRPEHPFRGYAMATFPEH